MPHHQPGAAAAAPSQWPLWVVVIGVLAGLGVALFGANAWRQGGLIMGASLGVGALERLALANRRAGLLQVRGKLFDVAVLALASTAIIVLVLAVPEGR
jgi:hypothetical protein